MVRETDFVISLVRISLPAFDKLNAKGNSRLNKGGLHICIQSNTVLVKIYLLRWCRTSFLSTGPETQRKKIKVLLARREAWGTLCHLLSLDKGRVLTFILTTSLLHKSGREENQSQEYESIICLLAVGTVQHIGVG